MIKVIPKDVRAGPLRWLADQILAWLQKRCEHPGHMVAVDITEGCGHTEMSYCNRCGAVRMYGQWRGPAPNLWRG